MKPKPLLLAACASIALLSWLVAPDESIGQIDAEVQSINILLAEINAQQTVIAENHTKIDDKLAAVAEEIRLARIYSGRSGGGGKTK
jgi:hypothetical protein